MANPAPYSPAAAPAAAPRSPRPAPRAPRCSSQAPRPTPNCRPLPLGGTLRGNRRRPAPHLPWAVPRLRSRGTFSSPLSLRPAGTGREAETALGGRREKSHQGRQKEAAGGRRTGERGSGAPGIGRRGPAGSLTSDAEVPQRAGAEAHRHVYGPAVTTPETSPALARKTPRSRHGRARRLRPAPPRPAPPTTSRRRREPRGGG